MGIVAVVTGGSSGIGKETALALYEKGCTVYEMSRRDSDIEGIHHITADITDPASVSAAVSRIIEREQHIDLLINNAGVGISGAVEFTDAMEAERLFDVNFFGMVRVTREILPHMRRAGKGRIVNVSSVAAVVPIPFQTFYSASKAAINSYTMALANEIAEFGIRVSAVMPGDIASGFTAARSKIVEGDELYRGKISRSVGRMEKDEQNGMSPAAAGRCIARIALDKRKKPLYTIGIGYQCAVILSKVLPSSLLNKVIRMLYAK